MLDRRPPRARMVTQTRREAAPSPLRRLPACAADDDAPSLVWAIPARKWATGRTSLEAPFSDDVFPACGRRRCPAAAQVREPPSGARDRDARARPGRPEVGARGRRPAAADPGLGAPGAVHRAARAQAGRGAARE